MEFKQIVWNGFNGVEFEFMGLSARVIKPNCKPNGNWVLKTEYFEYFFDADIEMLNRGYYLAFNTNYNRWAEPFDLDRKVKFVDYVSKTFDLNQKCILSGMSCGGLYAVKIASIIPEKIIGMYIDAPVMNLLSCPFAVGDKLHSQDIIDEYVRATGRTLSQIISYREHPIDKMPILLENNIPILLVSGDSDRTVPYHENGKLLEDFYRNNGGKIKVIIKKGCDHHPHGLENPAELVDELEKIINI